MAIPIIADINAKLNQQSMSSVLSSVKSQFQSQGIDLKVNIPDLSRNANGFRLIADSVDRGSDSIRKFGEQAGIATKRLLAYTAAVTAIIGPLNLLRTAVDEAIKFQREIIRVAQVAGDTKTELRGLQDQITTLAKTYGVSSLELVKAATIFRQAGFTARETADSVNVLAKALLAPNFDNAQQIAETVVALKSQFKDATKDAKALEDTIGGLNAVAGAFAVEAKDLEEVIKRSGGAFAAAGGNVQELIALFTSVRATTRESAETIATSFRTIFARLQRADIVDQLKAFGIELRRTREEAIGLGNAKLEGQFVGAYEAIRRLSAAIKDLPTTDPRFAAIAEEIGGYRQLSKTIPLLQQFATAQEALNVAQSGAASLNINAAQAQDAYLVRLTKLKEQLLDLGRNIVGSKGFAELFDIFTKGATAVLRLTEALGPLLPLLSILATIKITSGIASLFSGFGGGFLSRTDASGRAIHRSGGGSVPGVGIGDTVPAMLTPGEFVLRKEAVSRIGISTLNSMNAGKPQGYAKGGVVGYEDGGFISGNVKVFSPSQGKDVSVSLGVVQNAVNGFTSVAQTLGLTTVSFAQKLDKLGVDVVKLSASMNASQQQIAKNAVNLNKTIPGSEEIHKEKKRFTPKKRPDFDFSDEGPDTSEAPKVFKNTRKKVRTIPFKDEELPETPGVFKLAPEGATATVAAQAGGVKGFTREADLADIEDSRRRGARQLQKRASKGKDFTETEFAITPLADPNRGNILQRARDVYQSGAIGRGFDAAADAAGAFALHPIQNTKNFITGAVSGVKNRIVDSLASGTGITGLTGGIGGFGNLASTGGSLVTGAGNLAISGVSKIGSGLKSLGGQLSNPLVLGGAFLAAEQLRQDQKGDITAQRAAVNVNEERRFKTQEATKDALGGAQIGAGLGLAFGPLGVAAGALLGAFVGVTDSLEEAEKKISQVKLDEALGRLKTEIDDVAAGKSGKGTGNINDLLSNARKQSNDNTNKNLEPGFLSKVAFRASSDIANLFNKAEIPLLGASLGQLTGTTLGTVGSLGPDQQTQTATQIENFRKEIGLQLPQLNQIAGRQASEAAKTSIDVGGGLTPDQIKSEGSKFATSFSAANEQLITNIALIRQVSIDKVVKEFQKQFEDQAKALSLAKNKSDARAQSENILNSIDRLAKAFDAASAAANENARANSTLTDVFSGGISAVQSRNLGAGIGQLGVAGASSQAAFASSFGVIDKLVGSDTLRETTGGLNKAKQVLPDALVSALKNDPTGGDNFVVRLRAELAGVPKAIQDSIVTKLEGLDTAELTKKIRESTEKLADELTADHKPVQDALAKIAADVSAQTNSFISGLNVASKNQSVIFGSQAQSDNLRLEKTKLSAGFTASNIRANDQFSTATASDFFTTSQALQPFRNTQQRLLSNFNFGGRAINGENVSEVKQTFDFAKEQEKKALLARDAAAGTAGEGEAIKKFNTAQLDTANAAQALKNLADNSDRLKDAQDRLAGITERLSKIEGSKQAGINFNEKVFRAQAGFDFTTLRQVQLGQQGTNFLRRGGSLEQLRQFNPELALATSNALTENAGQLNVVASTKRKGDVERVFDQSPELEAAGRRAREIVNDRNATAEEKKEAQATLNRVNAPALVSNAQLRERQFQAGANPQVVEQQKAAEEAARKVEQDKVNAEKARQIEAANAYTEVLKSANAEFIAKLSETFDKFRATVAEQKATLEKNVLGGEKRTLETDIAGIQGGAVAAKKTLGGFGIKTDKQLDLVKSNAADLASIAALKKEVDGNDEITGLLRGGDAAERLNKFNLGSLNFSTRNGEFDKFDPEAENALQQSFRAAGFSDDKQIGRLIQQFGNRINKNPEENPFTLIRNITEQETNTQRETAQFKLDKAQARTQANFKNAGEEGLGTSLINNAGSIDTIIESTAKLGGNLSGVDKRLETFQLRLDTVNAALANVGNPNANFRGPIQPPEFKAFGGTIPSRGTDTVPAMLTPGEFVVRASSTRNNLALLNKINNSAGPVYAATGGVVPNVGDNNAPSDGGLKAAFDSFVNGTQSLVSALNAFPREITGTFTHRVEVIHNGLAEIMGLDTKIGEAVMAKVEKRFEDLGNNLRSQGLRV